MEYAITIQHRTFQFGLRVCRVSQFWKGSDASFIIRRQLVRSATSVGANMVEAKHSSTKQEFLRYVQISLRSSRESEYWLRMVQDLNEYNQKEISQLLEESGQISKILSTILMNGKGIRKR